MKTSKIVVLGLIGVLLVSGSAAWSLDTIIDAGCLSVGMISSFNPVCVPVLYDDIVEGSADDVRNDIYTKATFMNDGREQIITEFDSGLNVTYGISMAQGKTTAITMLNDGATESEAELNATGRVDDFYSMQQMRLINYRNRAILKFNTSINRIESTTGLTKRDVFSFANSDVPIEGYDSEDFDSVTPVFLEENVTLINGSKHEALGIYMKDDDPSASDSLGFNTSFMFMKPDIRLDVTDRVLRANNTEGDYRDFLENKPYSDIEDNLINKRQSAYDNVIGVVEGIYQEYSAGAVNTTDLLGPLELLKTASTGYADTGYYEYKALTLEQAGYPTKKDYGFKLSFMYDGTRVERWGQLFVPKGEITDNLIETGKVYDGNNITAWFVHETDTGNAVKTELDGDFEVLEMRNPETGEEINSTTLQEVQYHTNGTQDLEKQLEEIRDLEQHILDLESQLSGDDSSDLADWFNSLMPSWLPDVGGDTILAGLTILVAIIFVFMPS